MGKPEFPSWARFAKHASFTAGKHIAELKEASESISAFAQAVKELSEALRKPNRKELSEAITSLRTAHKEYKDINIDPLAVREAKLATLLLCGINTKAVGKLRDRFLETPLAPDLDSKLNWQLFKHRRKIIAALPELKSKIDSAFNAVLQSNLDIYEHMAPKLEEFCNLIGKPVEEMHSFLEGLGNQPGYSFMSAGLRKYHQALELCKVVAPTASDKRDIELRRSKLFLDGNIAITFGEQLYRAQPHFDKHSDTLKPIAKLMRIDFGEAVNRNFFTGTKNLDWLNIYSRFGIDPARAPADPGQIKPENLDIMLPIEKCRGTIYYVLIFGTYKTEIADVLRMPPC